MLRLIGIMTGAALAIAFLIIVLGVPEFSSPDTGIDLESAAEVATEAAPAAAMEAESVAEPAPEPEPAVIPEAVPEAAPVAERDTEAVQEPDYEALVEQIFAPEAETNNPVDENWYAFWSPFRSELAANGFVAKLQESTGIDYRVVKVKTGVYEVAFAYSDDQDIQDKLARISAATGLDMSDS